MKRIYIILALLFIALPFLKMPASAQSAITTGIDNFGKIVDFLPPAPNAAALAKAGIFNLNKNTGAVNINLPLMSLKGSKLNIPISLNYSSTGIKVDEKPSLVGLGWVLNCGGVVTRTVRGGPDELCNRVMPWKTIGYNWSTFNFLHTIVATSGNGADPDAQPDLFNFNFNGYSGSFVLDNSMKVVQIPKSNLRIEYNFNSTDWDIKITTPDGVKYYFGGSSAREKSKRIEHIGMSFSQYLATAWYLTKIEHPNGEFIKFLYDPITYQTDDAISESWDYIEGREGDCSGSGPGGGANNKSTTSVQGMLLRNIETSSFGAIRIDYVDRRRGQEKLISSIKYYNSLIADTLKQFKFYYRQYEPLNDFDGPQSVSEPMPYLTDYKEASVDTLNFQLYHFNYIDPDSRPSRLSYAQDHWGYFNGKLNRDFCPQLDVDYNNYYATIFPQATANREPDPEYAVKGMLSKITYPTGGVDSIVYESPTIKYTYNPRARVTLNGDVTGTGFSTGVSKTFTFSLVDAQKIMMINSTHCSDPDCQATHQVVGRVEIINSSGVSVFDKVYPPEAGETLYVPLNMGTYTLRISANGALLTTSVSLNYNGPPQTPVTIDKPVGGVRVKGQISVSAGSILKKWYQYENIRAIPQPNYVTSFSTSVTNMSISTDPGQTDRETTCITHHVGIYSNSLNNLFDYGSSITSYGKVTESNGDDFANGGTVSEYLIQPDVEAGTILGTDILLSGAKSNFSAFFNGRIKSEKSFKKMPDGSKIALDSTSYHYNEDKRIYKELVGYIASQNATVNYLPDTTNADMSLIQRFIDQYALKQYYIFSPWVYADTVKHIVYDNNGLHPVMTQSVNFFDNTNHLLATREENISSKGQKILRQNKYPEDFLGSTPYTDMVANNIIAAPIESWNFLDGSEISKTHVHYKKWDNNNFEVDSLLKSYNRGAYQQEGVTMRRDSSGNILQYINKNGPNVSYQWGYQNQYPVAQAVNANSNDIFYDGFEEGNGNSSLNDSKTGHYSHTGIYSKGLSGLDAGDYLLSYWQKSGNVWTWVITPVTVSGATYTISLNTQIDDVRFYPQAAQMTTYTYDPLVGMTSMTDAKGETTTYEYDGFQRLINIRNKDGNVIKHMDYHYQGQQ